MGGDSRTRKASGTPAGALPHGYDQSVIAWSGPAGVGVPKPSAAGAQPSVYRGAELDSSTRCYKRLALVTRANNRAASSAGTG